MFKNVIKIFRFLRECKGYSVIKTIRYSYLCKNIEFKDRNSKLFIDRNSKLHFGKNSKIIVCSDSVFIDKSNIDFSLPSNVFLANNSQWIIHGKTILHGSAISVWYDGLLETGDEFVCNTLTRISADKKIVFGNNVIIAHNCYFNDSNGHTILKNGNQVKMQKDIYVGNDVWFCANCTVLKGVKIGDNVVVAAGSTIVCDVPSNSIAMNRIEYRYVDDISWEC